jgi:hypothetical protein
MVYIVISSPKYFGESVSVIYCIIEYYIIPKEYKY